MRYRSIGQGRGAPLGSYDESREHWAPPSMRASATLPPRGLLSVCNCKHPLSLCLLSSACHAAALHLRTRWWLMTDPPLSCVGPARHCPLEQPPLPLCFRRPSRDQSHTFTYTCMHRGRSRQPSRSRCLLRSLGLWKLRIHGDPTCWNICFKRF
jgi:hypothetical protein